MSEPECPEPVILRGQGPSQDSSEIRALSSSGEAGGGGETPLHRLLSPPGPLEMPGHYAEALGLSTWRGGSRARG